MVIKKFQQTVEILKKFSPSLLKEKKVNSRGAAQTVYESVLPE